MNMNKALQNLYHAVSGETTTKVNISKLLVDIHYAITGKESENKNNWSKIVNGMADNWPEGGGGTTVEALSVTQNGTYTAPSGKAYSPVTVNVSGGSSDFSTATVTTVINGGGGDELTTSSYYSIPFTVARGIDFYMQVPLIELDVETGECFNEISIILYEGHACLFNIDVDSSTITDITVTGNGSYDSMSGEVDVTGDCTINITTA